MINNKTISLVLPCRNEAKAIQAVISQLPSYIDEVLVIDNNSSDKTVSVAKKLGARVFIETRTDNGIGYGFALATGIKQAKGDIIVCMDGDGSYPTSEIKNVLRYMKRQKFDFISCNRLPILKPKKMSAVRMFGVTVLNFFTLLFFQYPIKDSLTGMWVFKKSIVKNLSLYEGGWDFSLEIKLSAITNSKIKFGEFHIPYEDRKFDESKQNIFQTGFKHLYYLFEKRFALDKISFSPKISLLES